MSRSKNSLARRVRRAYRQDELARVLTMPEADFGRAYTMETTEVAQRGWKAPDSTPNDFYHFKDNGSRVLAVAHLDTVVRPDRRTPHFYGTKDGPAVTCGSLDDRLGAYVILRLLPRLGLSFDWLLTTGEESCQSTAAYFTSVKAYDHVIEFDRGGTDVVMYDYDDAATRRLVRASGAPVGQGSFTDICTLEQLGVKAFNWGVGYRGNYHSEAGYAVLTDTFAMVTKYLRFHAQNAGTALPHVPAPKYNYASDLYTSSRRRNVEENCYLCGAYGSVDADTRYCSICRTCADCEEDREDCQCWLPRYLRGKDRREQARDGLSREGDGDTTGKWLPWYMRPENKGLQERSPANGTWTATPIAIEAAPTQAELDNDESYQAALAERHGLAEQGWDRDPTQAELDAIQAELDQEVRDEARVRRFPPRPPSRPAADYLADRDARRAEIDAEDKQAEEDKEEAEARLDELQAEMDAENRGVEAEIV